MRLRSLLLGLTIGAALAACSRAPATDPAAQGVAAERVAAEKKGAELDSLYEAYWEAYLELNPIQATMQGDMRYNAELPDFGSAAYRERSRRFTTDWLGKIAALGAEGLSGQDLLNYQIFVADAQEELESHQFPTWLLPLDQMSSIATVAARFGSGTGAQPFKTVKDYEDWLARASRLPVLFDTSIANMREGVRTGVVLPKALVVKVIPQLDALIKDKPEETLFWGPIEQMPKEFSEADRRRLTEAYRVIIGDKLVPAYRELRDFMAEVYLKEARDSSGFDKLPNGAAWYAFNARRYTTTNMTPAQIHQIGLDEVARIHGEIRKVMAEVGFKGSMQQFFGFMQSDPRFIFKDEAALLERYRALEGTINQKIPQQFSLVPKAPFEIRPVEPFRAKSAAGGQYLFPSADGTRPGIFYVNTYDLPARKTWEVENIYLHEAIPGHHFQVALQIELQDIPAFRRWNIESAFAEGWGLYAESLGKDLGVYTDPYNSFGYLQNELWRAIRLVVDTGLHSKGWSREEVIEYMLENSAESRTQATAEAERYMAISGQALAYKIGELKIQELRARAERELGAKFDIREFHAEVLEDGSVPLQVLEDKINRWIASKQT